MPSLRKDHWQKRFRIAKYEQLENRHLLTAVGPIPANSNSALANLLSPAIIGNLAITSNSGVQQMPSVAVDPHDTSHVVVAYMDYSLVHSGYAGIGVAVSHDGGNTWAHSAIGLPSSVADGAASPTVRFDGQGHVFVSFMAATFLGP